MMKIAVTYERASTDIQENSVTDQRSEIARFAERNGYKIIKHYTDDGISGANASKRPEFLRMIDESVNGGFCAVLVYDSSRFARNLMEFLAYKKILQENNVKLISVTEPQIDDDMALFYDAITGASNEMYLRKLSREVKRGLRERSFRGNYTGYAPYGYDKVKHEDLFVINEVEAGFVKYMYEAILEGLSSFDIVLSLRERGATTKRGHKFDRRAIIRLLRSPVYKGCFSYVDVNNKEVVAKANNIPNHIVDPDTWEKVNAILSERSKKYKKNAMTSNRKKHWLSGLLRCPYCGRTITYRSNNRSDGSGADNAYFICSGYPNGICKSNKSIKVKRVEEIILEELHKFYNIPASEYSKNVTIKPPKVEIDYNAELKKIEKSLERAKSAYLAEIDSLEEYKENKRILQDKKQELLSKLESNDQTIKIDERAFKNNFINALSVLEDQTAILEDKKAVASALIERIELDAARFVVDIYFFA